jgi:hypothetical protein
MVGEPRRRVLVALETHWDRKQLEACRSAWEGTLGIAYPEPDDFSCPYDFDPFAWIGRAAAGDLGRIDGVLSSSDYPGATLAAAVATRLGLPGSRPDRVIGASHKYYSRIAQQRAAPEAVPSFALVDPSRPAADPPLPFPFFLKPVKGAFSVLARRIDDRAAFDAFVTSDAVREFTSDYMAIFNRLVSELTPFDVDGRHFVAEGLLSGDLVTVEGFVCDGQVEILGVVDSGLDPATKSFVRFDYPSVLPATAQEQMTDVARRVVLELGLERTLFNIEMMWDAGRERAWIVEVNPRICGQFADLYQKVDGTNSYQVALDLATGAIPRWKRGAGVYAAAASFPLRVFEPMRVVRAPDAAALAAAEADFPGALVWSECSAGEALADFDEDEDGSSHRYAVVNLGGASRDALDECLAEICAALDFELVPLRDR